MWEARWLPKAAARDFDRRSLCLEEYLAVDAELKRTARNTIDRILNLRDSL
jgi:hypothetical protein